MKNPKVSVIMPAYNSEKYVGEAIESILKQTFADFELIVLNDGSTDKTPDIIKKYAQKDKRIKFIDNSKNQGFIKSLNQCLDVATGEYIAKMDSDDISLPNRLEKQVKYLDEHPDVGLVGGSYQVFGQREATITFPKVIKFLDLQRWCCTSMFMLRKSIIDQNNLRFRLEYLHAEDYDFYCRFIRYAAIHNIEDVLCLYRWHGENVSNKYNEIQLRNSDKIRQEMLDFLTSDLLLQKKINEVLLPQNRTHKAKYYLFSFIPLLRIKQKGNKTKYYLFSFIPILKRKES